MCDRYILDEHGEPIPESDLMKWAEWFGSVKNRVVGCDVIGDSRVSTVFLGLEHPGGMLWETMVFGGPLNEEQDRCKGSREQAVAMHESMVDRVKATL